MTAPTDEPNTTGEKSHLELKLVLECEPIHSPRGTTVCWYDTPHSFAHALIDRAYESGYSSNKMPEVIAAAAYYATRIAWNRKMEQKEVAELFGVSRQAIAKHYEPMLKNLSSGFQV